jgi:tol-pal system protein YbgF
MRRTTPTAAASVLAATAAALTVAGCATKSDVRDLQDELRALAARQDSLMGELRRATLQTQDTIRGQSLQLFDFRGEIFRQLREIQDGLDRVEALAGENQRGIVGVRDQLANLRRMPTVAPGGGSEGVGEPIAGGGDAAEVFNAGVEALRRQSLTTARAAFESFLETYPTHELAPDAHFYLADILEQEGHTDEALAAFQEIPALFPTASRVPDALYRSALLQIERGETSAARAILERIVNTYPGTGAATLAEDRLREIR